MGRRWRGGKWAGEPAPAVGVDRIFESPRAGPVRVARDLRRRGVAGVVARVPAVVGAPGRGRRGQAVDRRASLGLEAKALLLDLSQTLPFGIGRGFSGLQRRLYLTSLIFNLG